MGSEESMVWYNGDNVTKSVSCVSAFLEVMLSL